MAVVTSARWSLPAVRSSVASLLTFAGLPLAIAACLAIGGFGFANGGYFPVSWGWGSIGLLALVAVVLVAGSSVELAALDRVFLGALAGLAGWISLSLIWTASVTQTVLEVERMLVYLAAGVAGVLLCRRATVLTLVLGVWLALAVICTYGLVTRLFPEEHTGLDQVAVDRLSEPVGYWNALGILAVMGLLLALGLAARGAPLVRCLGAGSTVIFALTLYFTYSRASWIALFVAFAVAVAVDRSRLQLITATLVVAPWGAVAIGIASTSDALTRHQESLVSEAARDGHGLAVIGIALAVGAALAVLLLDWLSSALSVPEGVRRVYVGTLLFCLAAVLIAVFGRYGFPPTLARKAYDAFRATNTEGNDLNQRLFSLSSNGRTETWHTAWQEARHHPVLGGGAGSYAAFWAQNRRIGLNVHDAHNLYVETLAELGPLGLALLLAVVGAPLAALRRARSSPWAAFACAGFVAFLLHAAADWDWEMPAVTLTGLFCAITLLAAGRSQDGPRRLRLPVRIGGLGAVAAVLAFAVIGLLGNSAVSASSKSTDGGHFARAEAQAHDAMGFIPWSPEPWRKLAEAQAIDGDLAAARVSFRKAIAKDRRDWTLWYELAEASSGAARRQALAQASRLNPLDPRLKPGG